MSLNSRFTAWYDRQRFDTLFFLAVIVILILAPTVAIGLVFLGNWIVG